MRVNNKGFTLVEILATITILSIVSVLAVGGYIRYADYAKKKAYVTMAKSASIAGEQFVMDNPGAAVEVEEQAKDGGVIYRIRNVDTAPGITFSELIEDAYLNSAVDPDDKGNKCTGTVRIGLVSAKEKNALDSYIYVVDVCCSLHQARYTYTMSKKDGKTSSVEEVTKPSYICGKGTPPAPTAAPVDPSPDDDTPTPTTTDVNLACPTVTAKSNGNNYTQGTTVSKPIEFTFHFDSNTKEYDWYTKKNSGDFKYWSTNNISVTKKKITSSGTHQIKIIIRDGKGNEKTCNYTGEYKIEDGASSPAPSPSSSPSPSPSPSPAPTCSDSCTTGVTAKSPFVNYAIQLMGKMRRYVNGVADPVENPDGTPYNPPWTNQKVEFKLENDYPEFINFSTTTWTYDGKQSAFDLRPEFTFYDTKENKTVEVYAALCAKYDSLAPSYNYMDVKESQNLDGTSAGYVLTLHLYDSGSGMKESYLDGEKEMYSGESSVCRKYVIRKKNIGHDRTIPHTLRMCDMLDNCTDDIIIRPYYDYISG